jgi:putative ABC transport system permease protein
VESTLIAVGPALVAVVAGLTVLGAAIAAAAHLGHGRNITTAAVRTALQLTVVAGLITAILDSLVLAALFVAPMYTVATATAGRRRATAA